MTYATLYLDDANLLTFHERREDAEAAVLEVVRQTPEVAAEYGFLAFDEEGEREGRFVSGAELLARRRGPS